MGPCTRSHDTVPSSVRELTVDERLLAAAKTDNEDLLLSAIERLNDVNYADG